MKPWQNLTLLAAACVVATAMCGCGSNDKEVSFKSGGMTQTFSEGQTAKDFPLPLYPNAKPTGSVQANGDADENSQFVILTSNDKVDQIKEFYADKLKEGGWEVTPSSVLPSVVSIAAKKNDLDANVMISGEEGKETTINLAVSKEPAGTPKASTASVDPDKFNPPTD